MAFLGLVGPQEKENIMEVASREFSAAPTYFLLLLLMGFLGVTDMLRFPLCTPVFYCFVFLFG